MKKFFKKNERGFTLAELLIVVAIIGVLVAVSIPIFTSQLEKSREATDVANMRAAKAAAVAEYLSADLDDTKWTITAATASTHGKAEAYYDADNGVIVKAKGSLKYGKGTTAKGGTVYTGYNEATDYVDDVIKITLDTDTGSVALAWE